MTKPEFVYVTYIKTTLCGGAERGQVSFYRARVLRQLPHPGRGFTQGLIVAGGTVWESTGLYGRSSLLRYRPGAAEPEASARLAPVLFGEGICLVGEHIWQLTWREGVALRWDARTLALLEMVGYNREGWGICHTGEHVFTSDGSSELVRRDPRTLRPTGLVRVRFGRDRQEDLNDLDWAAGRVWANVAGTARLVGIEPDTGEVADVVDARAASERHGGNPQAIMNGIAALPGEGEFLLTGKGWRRIYHVRLTERQPGARRRKARPGQ